MSNTRPLGFGHVLSFGLVLGMDGSIAGVNPEGRRSDNGEPCFTVDQLTMIVGGPFEIVNLGAYNIGRYIDNGTALAMYQGLRNYLLVINEEGKVKQLGVNPIASQLAGGEDVIVGNVLLCHISTME